LPLFAVAPYRGISALRISAPFAQATCAQPSAVAVSPQVKSRQTRRRLPPNIAADVEAALNEFDAADEQAQSAHVEWLCCKLREGGHMLTAPELATLEQVDIRDFDAMSMSNRSSPLPTSRRRTGWETDPSSVPSARGDVSARSERSSPSCGDLTSRCDRSRGEMTNRVGSADDPRANGPVSEPQELP
jgi:hypothetical protein